MLCRSQEVPQWLLMTVNYFIVASDHSDWQCLQCESGSNDLSRHFRDMDNTVSDELPLLNTGSLYCKEYWLPAVNEQVVCLMIPNPGGTGNSEGVVLGSFSMR